MNRQPFKFDKTYSFKNLLLWEEEIRKLKEEKYRKVHLEKAGPQNPVKTKKQKLKNQNNVVQVLCGYGASRSTFQLPLPVLVYCMRSCKRLLRPCQNSINSGITR